MPKNKARDGEYLKSLSGILIRRRRNRLIGAFFEIPGSKRNELLAGVFEEGLRPADEQGS
jgi:hypothetical protein